MDKTMAWFEREFAKGSVRAAQPLEDSGHVLSGARGTLVSESPFAESKEAVGGYMILRAGSIREAMDVVASWPLLEHGSCVEVRPIAEECPISRRMRARSESEEALSVS